MDAHIERIEAIKSQLEDPRNWRDCRELAGELSRLCTLGCGFPIGTLDQYLAAIDAAVADGYLERVGGQLVRRKPVSLEVKRETSESPKVVKHEAKVVKQQGFFDFED